MSEWTDADVEAVGEVLGEIETISWDFFPEPDTAIDDIARALLASGVVVPARVVEEAERERNNAQRVATMYQREIKGLRSAVEALAGWLCAFDIVDMPVPDSVDVPDDYELGINDAGARLAALLTEGRDRAGEGAGS